VNRLDTWLGGALVIVGGAVAVAARGYRVGFMVDPLGPRALPLLVSGIFLVAGSALILKGRRGSGSSSTAGQQEVTGPPAGQQEGSDPEEEPSPLGPQVGAAAILLAYSLAIPVLGFVLSTTLGTGALARLFGARWFPGLAVGLAFGLSLLALFSLGFGLDLPPGLLFGGSL